MLEKLWDSIEKADWCDERDQHLAEAIYFSLAMSKKQVWEPIELTGFEGVVYRCPHCYRIFPEKYPLCPKCGQEVSDEE